ncbi:hypothetical protein [Acinetobacter baumannii]|uniref:hypothetical protein n=1 Tax=Acinetobacter baumannii TaxID=470 RepID=UPI001D174AD9
MGYDRLILRGYYPAIKGKLARKEAQELLNDIGNGENPISSKQEWKIKELETNNTSFEGKL